MLIVLEHLWLWFLLYSLVGWVYESVLISIQQRRLVNRGFLNGPLCPIYGVGAVLMIVLLEDFDNPLVVFVLAALIASALEYATSWLMEVLFHARWWDYSHARFNLNGRICLKSAVGFGLGGMLVVLVVQPRVELFTELINPTMLHWLCGISVLLVVLDTVVTVLGIVDFEATMTTFKDFVQEQATKAGETWQRGRSQVSAGIRELPESSSQWFANRQSSATSRFNRQQLRMIRSFPQLMFKSISDNAVMDAISEAVRSRRDHEDEEDH